MPRVLACIAPLILTCTTVFSAPATKNPGKGTPLYLPVAVGTRSVYELKARAKSREIILQVSGVEKKDGTVIVTVSREYDGDLVEDSKYSASENGVSLLKSTGKDLKTPYFILKTSAKKGSSWVVEEPGDELGKGLTTKYVAGGIEDVEVPAGKFKALRVDSEYEVNKVRVHITNWYAPGVGMVKKVMRIDEREATEVLKSFAQPK